MLRTGKIVTALARAAAAAPADPLDAPDVATLTQDFLARRREIFRDLVESAVELGEILVRAKPLLHGHFQRWTRERLGVDLATADNYVALAEFARSQPTIVQRWRDLGPTKLYRLARLPPDGRRAVLRNDNLQSMTAREFTELTGKYVVHKRKVTGNMRGHGFRMKLRAFTEMLRRTRLPAIEDQAMRASLRQEIAALTEVLRELDGGI